MSIFNCHVATETKQAIFSKIITDKEQNGENFQQFRIFEHFKYMYVTKKSYDPMRLTICKIKNNESFKSTLLV